MLGSLRQRLETRQCVATCQQSKGISSTLTVHGLPGLGSAFCGAF